MAKAKRKSGSSRAAGKKKRKVGTRPARKSGSKGAKRSRGAKAPEALPALPGAPQPISVPGAWPFPMISKP